MRLASRSFRAIAIVLALAGMPLFAGSAAAGRDPGRFSGDRPEMSRWPEQILGTLAREGSQAGKILGSFSFRVVRINSDNPSCAEPQLVGIPLVLCPRFGGKLQSSFKNSDLTLFALVRMVRGRKLRGLLSEDSGAR